MATTVVLSEASRTLGEPGPSRCEVVVLNGLSRSSTAAEEIRSGLSGYPKTLPPKYFYDARGSDLFERITDLPEYYLTRVEHRLMRGLADRLMAELRPCEVIELGSGMPAKIRYILGSPSAPDHLRRYIPFDVDEGSVRSAAAFLTRSYPFLEVRGIVGDFESHLEQVGPSAGRRLVLFFGSTIGNLDPPERDGLLRRVRGLLAPGDRFLLGVDLVKATATVEAAYNDSLGVTADFNRNILRVVNRAVDADFVPSAFEHQAFYNELESRIEMHLVPSSPQTIDLRDLSLRLELSPDQTIWTESSYKFTRDSTAAMLEDADLRLDRWYSDRDDMFGLALAAPG